MESERLPLIYEMIEAQARLQPSRKAAIFRDRELTYQELIDEVNSLSAHLQRHGVGIEGVVAICLERSLEMLVAMLAVLRAGGAYLPLDPRFPPERLDFMLADSRATAIITHSGFESRPARTACKTIFIDHRQARHEGVVPAETLRPAPSNLAYLIYTSGSTGKPKGVMVEHRNLLNFVRGMDEVLGTEPGVWLAVTSISFDISILELLWTLARGYSVVIQSDEEKLLEAGEFGMAARLTRDQVTHLQCTPTMAEQLVRRPQIVEGLQSLRKLLLGGETLPVSLVDYLSRTLGGDILNMYGPTETTIWSTAAPITPGHAVTIGKPMHDTQVYLVDESGHPCSADEVGEIYIGGGSVARGYWQQPQLTAERFVMADFGGVGGQRLYRTGDLGRFRADGSLEHLGRIDHQIKIRGYRVELGEIETVLREHPAVAQAIVVPCSQAGSQQLAAYVVVEKDHQVTATELRVHATRKLPDYMIPAVIVFLAELPTTPNGKVDRKALPPAPASPSAGENEEIAKPTSILEKKIASVWGEVLGIAAVGIHQNFFELGATSLIAAEAVVVLRETLNQPLKLTDLFAHPTVSELALFLTHGAGGAASQRGAERGSARLVAMRRRRRAIESANHEF